MTEMEEVLGEEVLGEEVLGEEVLGEEVLGRDPGTPGEPFGMSVR